MSVFDKLMGKTDAEAVRKEVIKERDRSEKQSMKIAEYYGILGMCKETFEKTITTERLNALERREKRVGDASQKARIHDAAVGLLAIEETELELQSAALASDFQRAQKKLGYVIKQMSRLDPKTSITKSDYLSVIGVGFDDSNETEDYVERADLVDEQFVEYLIQGYDLEECLEKKLPMNASSSGGQEYNFSSGSPEEDMQKVNRILEKNADKR